MAQTQHADTAHRHGHGHRYRDKDRHTDTQHTDTDTETQKHRHRYRQTHRHRHRHRERHRHRHGHCTQDPPALSTSGTLISGQESPADTHTQRRTGATCDSLCKSRVFREVPHPSRDLAVYTIIMTGPGPCGGRERTRSSRPSRSPPHPDASSRPPTALSTHPAWPASHGLTVPALEKSLHPPDQPPERSRREAPDPEEALEMSRTKRQQCKPSENPTQSPAPTLPLPSPSHPETLHRPSPSHPETLHHPSPSHPEARGPPAS